MAGGKAGLFIDLDGTLADSLSVMKVAYRQFLANFGKPDDPAEFDRLNGPPLDEVIRRLAETHGLPQPFVELQDLYRSLVRDAYRQVAPNDGAGDLLDFARGQGYAVAVVTSNSAMLCKTWLGTVGLLDHVDHIVGGEDVTRGKPDPEPYLLALQRTGCAPDSSFAIEDSLSGALSATGAGIPTLLLHGAAHSIPAGTTAISRLADAKTMLRRKTESLLP